jgi:hypothetical protein
LSHTSRNWCTDPIRVIHQSMRINVNYNKYALSNPRHETVTHGSSKAFQLFVLKLRRFWHHRNLCSIVKKWKKRADRQTHTHTHIHTHTHTHTHTDTNFFIALSCLRTSKTSRKIIKTGGINFFFSHEFNTSAF